jgi:hypothetical protein
MPNTDQPAGPPAVADKTVTFDPGAAGWEPYRDEGFIGLVGPFWMRQSGDSYLLPSWPNRSTTTAAASFRVAC